MSNDFNLKAQRQALKKELAKLPKVLGNMKVQFFKARFQEQGWRGGRFVPWAKRNAKAKRNAGRALLIDTGRLRRSIRITKSSGLDVTVGSDVPYARAHNEGMRRTVKVQAHTRNQYKKSKQGTGKFTKTGKERMKTVSSLSGYHQVSAYKRKVKMPKRQFMGESPYLNRLIKHKIETTLVNAIK